jgi:hypothetical protein
MTSFLPYVTKLAEKTMALHLSLAWATMAFTRFWRALSPCGLTLQKLARFLLLYFAKRTKGLRCFAAPPTPTRRPHGSLLQTFASFPGA